ncbi:hypothetical protein FQR65_LT03878 [Abscondita terminalis]|nr:hypothetical protein FQR65_LT03878 [Abscondita terminalis]
MSNNNNSYNNLNAGSEFNVNNTGLDIQLHNPIRNNTFRNESDPDITLKSINVVPQEYREIFSNYHYFNKIQSQVLDSVLYTDESIAVSAPTGSGKTVIFELAVVRFMQRLKEFGQQIPYKIVYVAPLKALCEERLADWFLKFAKLGLNCISVTVHLLNDNQRGPTVEVIVSRMKTIQDCTVDMDYGFESMNLRFVAVSATIPNVADIGEWLSTPQVKAQSFKFNEDMRPVKLKKVVIGYNSKAPTPFKFDIMLNYKLQSVMLQYAEGKPTLIFCSTRKNVEMTSRHLSQNLTINLNIAQQQILRQTSCLLSETKLKEILIHGIAYHHAGLSQEDRKIVEDLFRKSELPILVTTTTLAMGINLPAHLVIIKSTKHYSNGEYQDYSESMMLQMIGRAGRPQFDTSATAVILTTASDKLKYENMVDDVHPVESNLHKNLTEHLNAEVVLRTIIEFGDAVQWVTTTYLYVRAGKNPKHYGIPIGLTSLEIDKKLLEMCLIQIHKLARSGMLIIDQNDGQVKPTDLGTIMAKYYVALDTMKLFAQVTGTEILPQILSLISKCKEFSEMHLRVNDKKTLNLLNKCRGKETIRFPFNDKIRTVEMKINCLIQAVLGCLPMLESSLVNESLKIMRVGERIANCLAEYLSTRRNCYSALLNTLILAKCFHVKLWENSPYASRQLLGIGPAYSAALAEAGKTSFQSILESNPRHIEMIINRKPSMGNIIQDQIQHLPQYELEIKQLNNDVMEVKVSLRNFESVKIKSSVNKDSIMTLLIGDHNNNIILLQHIKHIELIETPTFYKTFTLSDNQELVLQAHFISADWVGIDCETSFHSSSTYEVTNSTVTQFEETNPKKATSRATTSHVQMLVDTYFKHQKVPEKRHSTKDLRKKRNHPAETVTSSSLLTPDIYQENSNKNQVSEIDKTNITYPPSTVSNILKECQELDVSTFIRDQLQCSFDDMNSLKSNTTGGASQSLANQYKLLNQTKHTVNADLILASNNQNQELCDNYRYQPRKKFKSTITTSEANNYLPSSNKIQLEVNDEDSSSSGVEEYMAKLPLKPEELGAFRNTQKSISWSSPLVVSPSTKYSPAKATPKIIENTNLVSCANINKAAVSSCSQAYSVCESLFTQASAIRPKLKNNLRSVVYDYPLSDKKFFAQHKQSANTTNDVSSLNISDFISPTLLPTSNLRQQQNSKKPVSVADYYLKTLSNSADDQEVAEVLSKSSTNVETQTCGVSVNTTQDAATSPINFAVDDQTSVVSDVPVQTSLFEYSHSSLTKPQNTIKNMPFLMDNSYHKPQSYNTDYKMLEISQMEEDFCTGIRRPQNYRNLQPSVKHYFYPDHDSSNQSKNGMRCYNQNYQFRSQPPTIPQRFAKEMYYNMTNPGKVREDVIERSFCDSNMSEVYNNPFSMHFPRTIKQQRSSSEVLQPNNYDWNLCQIPQTLHQYNRIAQNFNKPAPPYLNSNNDLLFMRYHKPINNGNDNPEYSQYFPCRPIPTECCVSEHFEDSYEK